MDLERKDRRVIAVMLKRFENERYPKVQVLKAEIDNGAVLDDQDLAFLEHAPLAKGVLLMYEEIMSKSELNSNQT